VPAPEREQAPERRWRLELRPLTPQQQQQVATMTLGTAMLLLLMILLAPVGA
jgi:CHASE1-domain containing sensor protein